MHSFAKQHPPEAKGPLADLQIIYYGMLLPLFLFLFEKLVWILEHTGSNQFIFMSFAKFQWS